MRFQRTSSLIAAAPRPYASRRREQRYTSQPLDSAPDGAPHSSARARQTSARKAAPSTTPSGRAIGTVATSSARRCTGQRSHRAIAYGSVRHTCHGSADWGASLVVWLVPRGTHRAPRDRGSPSPGPLRETGAVSHSLGFIGRRRRPVVSTALGLHRKGRRIQDRHSSPQLCLHQRRESAHVGSRLGGRPKKQPRSLMQAHGRRLRRTLSDTSRQVPSH